MTKVGSMVLLRSTGLECRGSGSPRAFKQVTFPSGASVSLLSNANQRSAFLPGLVWGSRETVARRMLH